ncbi:MAG TPA: tetratricopeptide repeat protein, partial [Blastocatellia bacterium]|nr:tetratricopeptide repeat protein [Blastocatellia bacterium]
MTNHLSSSLRDGGGIPTPASPVSRNSLLPWPYLSRFLWLSIVFTLWGCLVLVVRVSPASAQGSEADVAVNQAILDYEAGRYDEALRLLRETLSSDPNHIEALYYVGLIRMAQKQYDPAIVALERARELAPRDLAIAFHLGVVYFALEQYDKAEPLLTEVFNADPTRDSLGYYVGFMRYRRKDYQGALDAFSADRSTDLTLQQLTRFYKSLALAILGRPEQAVAELDEASRIRTVSPLTGPADRLRDTIVAAKERER